jgi:hypothetical protein
MTMRAKNAIIGSCLALVLLACSQYTPRPAIPAYPNQSTMTTSITPGPGYGRETIAFVTTDAEANIQAYYARQLPTMGWKRSRYNWETGLADDGWHYDSSSGCPVYMLAIHRVPAPGHMTVTIQIRTDPCV